MRLKKNTLGTTIVVNQMECQVIRDYENIISASTSEGTVVIRKSDMSFINEPGLEIQDTIYSNVRVSARR